MIKPSSSVPPPGTPASTDTSTTAASPESAEGKREEASKIPPKPKGALERNWLDGIFGKYAYQIVIVFVVVGAATLLWLGLPPLLQDISKNGSISGNETVRNAYYFLIFIGAGFATILATWRGRQSEEQIRQSNKQIRQSDKQILQSDKQIEQFERQLENARFEKAIDMATDLKSRPRRASGFRILEQMLSAWKENSDDTTEKNIYILDYLVFNSFRRTLKQRKAFIKLYENSKTSFGSNEVKISNNLFHKTHKPDINVPALSLWQGIINWNRRKWGNSPVPVIYAAKSTSVINESHWFIFSGSNLGNLQFFVMSDEGEIIPSNQSTRANFKGSCLLQVDMHGATVDYVNFSESHFSRINYERETMENCKISGVGTIFDRANLIACNFRGANFKDASFVGITTIRVIFDEANLTDCKFEGANLGGASFVEANISGSDFRLAKNLTQEQFQKGAYWIMPAKPQFPKGWDDDFINSLAKHAQN